MLLATRCCGPAFVSYTVLVLVLAADPFDRPDGFPELVVNRIQALTRVLMQQPKPEVRFAKSVFGQLLQEMDSWPSERFRRYGHCALH